MTLDHRARVQSLFFFSQMLLKLFSRGIFVWRLLKLNYKLQPMFHPSPLILNELLLFLLLVHLYLPHLFLLLHFIYVLGYSTH